MDGNANNTNRVGIKLRQHIGNCDYYNSMVKINNCIVDDVDAVVI